MDLSWNMDTLKTKKRRISLWQHLRFVMVLKKSTGKLLPPKTFRAADITRFKYRIYTDFSSYKPNLLLLLIALLNPRGKWHRNWLKHDGKKYLCAVIYLINVQHQTGEKWCPQGTTALLRPMMTNSRHFQSESASRRTSRFVCLWGRDSQK